MKNIKPSELLRLAIGDLEKVEAMPETYKVNMGAWHDKANREQCHVCLAGAVMAMTLHVPPDEDSSPGHFTECAGHLHALNHFRVGNVESGLNSMCITRPSSCTDRMPVTGYNMDSVKFKRDMIYMSDYLENKGL
jgi:hypothetical protein